jgi:hypothetical protein
MQTDLGEAARRGCKTEEILGAVGFINHLGKACFIRGLHNERIQAIVRSRGEPLLLSQAIEISLEEEGAIHSVREISGDTGTLLGCHECSTLGHTSNKSRSSERFPHARAREVRNDSRENKSYSREVMNCTEESTSLTPEVMSCFNCGREGHVAKNCRQGSDCRKCGMKGHTKISCRAPNKGWTQSGNKGRGCVSNPRTAQDKKQKVVPN